MMSRKIKRHTQSGVSYPVVFVAILLAAAFVLIVVLPMYRQHLRDADRTFDAHTVATARDVATVRYLQDGESGLKIYYYDELAHEALDREQIGQIKPYGRSSAGENAREETGARGVPNRKDLGGPQILAVAVAQGESVNMRWTGKEWSYLDYYYMTEAERTSLTIDERIAIDKTSELRALSRAKEAYAEDFAGQLKKGENSGEAVYLYNALENAVYYADDSAVKCADRQEQALEDMQPYDVDQSLGQVVVVTVRQSGEAVQAEAAWQKVNE